VTNALLPAYVNATDSSGQPAFRYHEVLPVSSEVIACKGSIAEFSPTNHLNRAFCITKRSRRRELGLMIINDQDPNSDSEEQNLTQSLTLKRRGLDMRIGPVGFAVIVSLWDCCRLSHSVLTNGLKCCHLLGRPVKPARSIIGSKEYPTFNLGKEQQLQNMFMPT
jgi:hypothetical protein